MKKIVKFLTSISTLALASPAILILTSCKSTTLSKNFKYLDYKKYNDKQQYFWQDMSSPDFSITKMLYGNTKFNNGNYCFVLGSCYADDFANQCAMFNILFNSDSPKNSSYNISDRNLTNSILYDSWKNSTSIEGMPNGVSFISYIDLYYSANTEEEKTVLPSDGSFAKWTKDDEEKDENHKEGKYKRTDDAAKVYRDIVSTISILFSNFEESMKYTDWSSSSPYLMFWKEGKPSGVLEKPQNEKEISDKINEIYKKDKNIL